MGVFIVPAKTVSTKKGSVNTVIVNSTEHLHRNMFDLSIIVQAIRKKK